MSNLIDELRSEHQKLASILLEVKELGPTREGRRLLGMSKAALLAHLKKEDSFLYPELQRAAVDDPRLQEVLSNFASDMDKISKAAINFFAEWEMGGDALDFVKEIETLIAVLQSRIRREETILYPEYLLLLEKKAA